MSALLRRRESHPNRRARPSLFWMGLWLSLALWGCAEEPSGEASILRAARHGDLITLRNLTESGTPLNQTGLNGLTALELAAQSGHAQAVELLALKGASLQSQSPSGPTPLHRAAKAGHPSVVAQLLALGILPDQATSDHWRPLHDAAQAGHVDVIEILLSAGALPDHPNSDPVSPLSLRDVGNSQVRRSSRSEDSTPKGCTRSAERHQTAD